MTSGPTRKQTIAGAIALSCLLVSMLAKDIVESRAQGLYVRATPHLQDSPVQRVIDLDAHHFRHIRVHQQLWDPGDKEDVLKIATLGKQYHNEATAVDIDQCPKAFRIAYADHLEEWSTITKALTSTVDRAEDKETLMTEVRQITKDLEDTWANVRTTAQEAGVYIRN